MISHRPSERKLGSEAVDQSHMVDQGAQGSAGMQRLESLP